MENSVGIVETKYFKFDGEILLESKKTKKHSGGVRNIRHIE